MTIPGRDYIAEEWRAERTTCCTPYPCHFFYDNCYFAVVRLSATMESDTAPSRHQMRPVILKVASAGVKVNVYKFKLILTACFGPPGALHICCLPRNGVCPRLWI
uniref:Uncharacterized protein n=1 Tax=Panagrellus redivivus TaxID=6233 RepID=A0A7E4W1D1_PANRE